MCVGGHSRRTDQNRRPGQKGPRSSFSVQPVTTPLEGVFPEEVAAHPGMQREADRALNVLGDWLTHAMWLLVRGDINMNPAHNKLKHGLAVRARDDVLATVTTQAPNSGGESR